MFEARTYIERRRQLRNLLGDSIALIYGHSEAPRNYRDNTYDFRQNSSFLYFAGHSIPGMFLISTPDGDYLSGYENTVDDIIWTGPLPSLGELAEQIGVSKVIPSDKLSDFLGSLGAEIHYLPPYRGDDVFMLASLLGKTTDEIRSGSSRKLLRAVVDLRLVKETCEIVEIEKALAASWDMYQEAARYISDGTSEYTVMAAMKAAAMDHNCTMSFTPIVTIRGEVLHNHSYGGTLKNGNLILLDSGAETLTGYASDITRTFPVSGKFSEKQAVIYQTVLNAWKKAVSMVKPDVTMKDLHLAAATEVVLGLISAGLMKGNASDAVEAGAHAMFFPHGLGHMMGLDVHDMEDLGDYVGYGDDKRSGQFGLAFLRMARKLKPGYVFTVEPGIYFIDALIDKWKSEGKCRDFINYDEVDKFRGLGGIRIEDDILVTDNGGRILGKNEIPREIIDVEGLFQDVLMP